MPTKSPYKRLSLNGRAVDTIAAGGTKSNPAAVVLKFRPRAGEYAAPEAAVSSPKALTAAAARVDLSQNRSLMPRFTAQEWQREAYALTDITGEAGYASRLYGNGLSQLHLHLWRRDENGKKVRLSELKDSELTAQDRQVISVMNEFQYDQSLDEMLNVYGQNRFIAGEAVLVGTPRRRRRRKGSLLDYTWGVYSREDVQERNGVLFVDGEEYDPSTVVLTRVWNPHPRIRREANSPIRPTLPVLRELVGLTMHVSATIDSRLAGAGVFIIPNSAVAVGLAPAQEDEEDENPVMEAIIEGAVTPIKDRDSAAAVVPVLLSVPDDCGFQPFHLTFATPFDSMTRELRDEAIRRLAGGWDMPAALLLGDGTGNHWSAWLAEEQTVKFWLLPGGKEFARAVVGEFLRPVLEELGFSEEDADSYGLAVDGDHLISRPNKFAEAMELYKAGLLRGESVVTAATFELSDMPDLPVVQRDPAVALALEAVQSSPNLLMEPGLPAVISQFRAALAGQDASTAPEDALPAQPATPEESEGRPEQNPSRAVDPADTDRTTNEPGPARNRPRDNTRP